MDQRMSLPGPFKAPTGKVTAIVKSQTHRRKISVPDSEDEDKVDATIEGYYKGASVTVSFENDTIIWVQAGRKAKLPGYNRLLKSDKQPKSIRIPLCDIISIVADNPDEDDVDNNDARLTIVARRPADGAAEGRWRLWERVVSPLLSGIKVGNRWSARVCGERKRHRRQVQRVGLLINTSVATDWNINRVLLPNLKRFDIEIHVRIDAPNARQLAESAGKSATKLKGLDSLLIVGGDGTVQQVCASLLEASPLQQQEPSPMPPLCLLPSGRHTDIARSLMGGQGADFETALAHLLAGHTRQVNCTSVLSRDCVGRDGNFKFHTWCFNAALGLPTAALACLNRHSFFPDTKYQRALDSVIAKPDFRPVSGKLTLKISAAAIDRSDVHPCLPGCSVCEMESRRQRRSSAGVESDSEWQCDFSDPVREFDPSDCSNCSSMLGDQLAKTHNRLPDLTEIGSGAQPETKSDGWRTICCDFIWIGVYSITGLSGYCPGGLSPGCHANDGCLEVVLLRLPEDLQGDEEQRKRWARSAAAEFAAAVCGSSGRSHLSLDYVSSYRCKAVRFLPDQLEEETQACGISFTLNGSKQDSSYPESAESRSHQPSPRFQRSPSQLADILCGDDADIDTGDDGTSSNGAAETVTSEESGPPSKSAAQAGKPESRKDSSNSTNSQLKHQQQQKPEPQKQNKTKKSWRDRLAELKPARLLQTTAGSGGRASNSNSAPQLAGRISPESCAAPAVEAFSQASVATADLAQLSRWNFDYGEVDSSDEFEFRCHPDALEVYCPAPGSTAYQQFYS